MKSGIGGLRMQDRFKFRVFISDKKNSKNSLTGMFKVHSLHTGTNKATISSLYGNCSIKLENNILMQCTGLEDKNGKLIYEGDILKTKEHNLCKEGELFKVFYQETLCQFLGKSLTTDNCIDLCDLYEDEVIGNIYENPELLED